MVPQKEKDNFPAIRHKDMEYCNLTNGEFKVAFCANSTSYKKTQKGNAMNSGINLMNRRSILPKRLKFFKRTKQRF